MSGWQQVRGDQLVAPAWLASLAQDAKVEAYASKELNQFVTAAHGQTSARDVILSMTGMSMHVTSKYLACATSHAALLLVTLDPLHDANICVQPDQIVPSIMCMRFCGPENVARFCMS